MCDVCMTKYGSIVLMPEMVLEVVDWPVLLRKADDHYEAMALANPFYRDLTGPIHSFLKGWPPNSLTRSSKFGRGLSVLDALLDLVHSDKVWTYEFHTYLMRCLDDHRNNLQKRNQE